jgi:lipopolysaccharide export system protein LptC
MIGSRWLQVQHYWLPLGIIGALVLVTTWLGQLAEQHPLQDNPAPGHNPDYFVDDLHATAYDITGTPRYHLTASKMQHYIDNDTTTLESPVFLRDGPGVPRVEARSNHGLVSAKGDIVYLLDGVKVTQASLAEGLPIMLTTEYLEVRPNSDRLSTDKPVILQQGTSVLRGNSMVADGKAKTLQLSGRVKGIYEIAH